MKSSLGQDRLLVHNPSHLGGRNKFLSATIAKTEIQLTVSLCSIQFSSFTNNIWEKKIITPYYHKRDEEKVQSKILVHYEFFRFTQRSEQILNHAALSLVECHTTGLSPSLYPDALQSFPAFKSRYCVWGCTKSLHLDHY